MRSFLSNLRFFALGAVLGPIGDTFHVLSGTLSYPLDRYRSSLWGMPFWTPLLFGSATWLIAWFQRKVIPHETNSRDARAPLGNAACFLALYCLSGYLCRMGAWAPDLILALVAIPQCFFFIRSRPALLTCVAVVLAGTFTEALLVQAGVFQYLPGNTALYGVPTWLPWLYLSASVSVAQFRVPASVDIPAFAIESRRNRRSA